MKKIILFCILGILLLGLLLTMVLLLPDQPKIEEAKNSIPVINAVSLPSTYLSTGQIVLYRWTIKADGKSKIGWREIEFNISGTFNGEPLTNDYFPIAAITGGAQIWDAESNTRVIGIISSNHTADGSVIFFETTNEQVIAAGKTRVYELRGNIISPIKNGDVVSIKINKKSTSPLRGTYASLLNTPGAFLWTDRSAINHSESTPDWANDYNVSGLPTAVLTLVKK